MPINDRTLQMASVVAVVLIIGAVLVVYIDRLSSMQERDRIQAECNDKLREASKMITACYPYLFGMEEDCRIKPDMLTTIQNTTIIGNLSNTTVN